MNEKKLRQLIKIVEESDINELEVSRWGRRVRITKISSHHNGTADIETIRVGQKSGAKETAPDISSGEPELLQETGVEIKSPMVGTFYASPAPDASPYVSVGDKIKVGDVLCIIEAMKLMNEIEAEEAGVISKILVENADPVQYNQPLFLLEAE